MFASPNGILDTSAPLPAGIRVSDAPVAGKRVMCSIQIESRIRPEWLTQTQVIRMPVAGLRTVCGDTDVLAWAVVKAQRVPLITGAPGGSVCLHFDPYATFENILFEKYATTSPPLLARLPMDYHKIPGSVRGVAARVITMAGQARRSDSRTFPSYPVETSLEALTAVLNICVSAPEPSPCLRVLLTHDADEPGSLKGIQSIAESEQAHGVRSLWFIAGKLFDKYQTRIQELMDAGHEIGLHGIRHDMKFPFLSAARMRAQLDSAKKHLEKFAIRGFRSPYYLRTKTMFSVLSDYVAFDSSVPDSDRFSLGANPGGCCVVRPFMRDGLVELPVTLPFEIPWMSGVPAGKLLAYWHDKINFVGSAGGLLVVNTHPDMHVSGRPDMRAVYCDLLELLKEQGARFVVSGDIIS